jgi:pimeloyl-[acyl-carrier protein] methyl ester esterase
MRGFGPDLVLLHGWGLNLRVWDGLARELSKLFRVITVDLPGHGRSPWNPKARTPAEQAWQVHATLASRTDRYSLVGWSLGGQIALDLAAAMPGSVERLALVATTPRFAASEDWPYGMPAAALDRLATQLRTNYKRTVSEFLELQVRGSVGSEKVLAELHGSLFSHGEAHPKALVAGLATLKSSDLRSNLSLIHTPTLVVAGQYDRVTLPAASRALAAMLPDARYVEFRRAAHAPFLSHAGEFAALVTRFLRGEPVEATPTGEVKPGGAVPITAPAGAPAKADDTDSAALEDALSAERILTSGQTSPPKKAEPVPPASPPSASPTQHLIRELTDGTQLPSGAQRSMQAGADAQASSTTRKRSGKSA